MNQKQKFGYTVLGALIMLVGIGIGSIVSPPLIAQGDGVFDEIKCTKLTVVDKAGKPAVALATSEDGNRVTVTDKAGKPAFVLSTDEEGNRVTVADKAGKPAVALAANKDGNHVVVIDKAGKLGVALTAGED